MGAQHSHLAHGKHGGMRLRRRAPTMGITTNAEIQGAGVDIEQAVKISEAHIQAHIQAQKDKESLTGPEAQAAALHASAASRGSSALAPGSPGMPPQSPDSPGNSGRRHPSSVAKHMQMPPWEVVASLGESDWFAFKAWMEGGWTCKSCGCVREDAGDHPKAAKLLCSCGIAVPGFKGHVAHISHPSAFSPASSPSRGGAFGYASESPDNQIGYLSDQSLHSAASSRGASPMHPGGRGVKGDDSPRFANELTGKQISFPEHAEKLAEALNLKQQAEEMKVRQFQGGYSASGCPVLNPQSFRNAPPPAPRTQGCPYDGVAVPGQLKENPFGDMGPDEGAHVDTMGLQRQAPRGGGGSRPGSFKERGGSMSEDFLVPQILRKQEEELQMKDKILSAVTRANQIFFVDKEPNGTLVFDFLLSALLDITNSPYGWISSALLKADGTPYIKTHAMSNVCWNQELKGWYALNAHKGLVFTNLNSLHGSIVYSGQPVITNNAQADPRARGVPAGHPPINRFFGIPLFTGMELIGIYGVADSPDGYSEQQMRLLEPLTLCIAQMIYAVNERKRRREAELQLSSIVQVAQEGIMSMTQTGQVTSINVAAREMFGIMTSGGLPAGEEAAMPHGLNFYDMIPELDGRERFLRRGLEPQAGHRHNGVARRADGSAFPVEVAITKGTFGTTFYVAVIKDLSSIIALRERVRACRCGQQQQYHSECPVPVTEAAQKGPSEEPASDEPPKGVLSGEATEKPAGEAVEGATGEAAREAVEETVEGAEAEACVAGEADAAET